MILKLSRVSTAGTECSHVLTWGIRQSESVDGRRQQYTRLLVELESSISAKSMQNECVYILYTSRLLYI